MTQSFRFFKLRFATGVVLALPLILGVIWYAWSAYAQMDRYRRAVKKEAPAWTLELFQLALHDELVRDFRRLAMPERPHDSSLPTFELSLTRDSLDSLRDTSKKGSEAYVKTLVRKGREMHEGRIRYRGDQPWHWIGAQKSMKVRLDRGDLMDGTRVFNLLNDATPFGLEDEILLDLARERGIITPEYFPAWVRINNTEMGVYRYEAQPEEGLLRRTRRMPGSIYSGDSEALKPGADVGGLFWDKAGWSKVAFRDEAEAENFDELERFLHAITTASNRDFATFAESELDLDKYAFFDALDVVFGGNDHDYFSNHKFYVDPYRGKFEPIAWSFRGFQDEPRLNLVDNPLLIRLKFVPGYLTKRNRAVYELLTGKASLPEIRTRASRAFAKVAGDLAADPYWDAYKLLPRVTRFHRFMVRPMSANAWMLSAQNELFGFAKRSRFLLDRLEQPGIDLSSERASGGIQKLVVRAFGDAAYALRQVVFPGCHDYALWADDDRDGVWRRERDSLIGRSSRAATLVPFARAELTAGLRLVARDDPQPKHGDVWAEGEPRNYVFFLTGTCAPGEIDLVFDDLTTGGSTRLTTGTSSRFATDDPPKTVATSTPTFSAGERSPHPWDFPAAALPETVILGPGDIAINASRVFTKTQAVRIVAGTRLLLAANASLVFLGPLTIEGEPEAKVHFVRRDANKAFGGLILQGPATAGSRLRHFEIVGGSHAGHESFVAPGLLNIHDSHDVTIDGANLVATTDADDVVHVAYVNDLRLYDVVVHRPPVDGVDLEFVTADLRGVQVTRAGDDCLDLMGTNLRLADSVLSGCTNNGVSAGEETEVAAHGVLIADSKIGVLAKNASSVRLTRSLVFRSKTALNTRRHEVHYAGESSITAGEFFAVDCDEVSDVARGSTLDAGHVQLTLPERGLEHLRSQVLRLSSWSELGARLAVLDRQETRAP